MNIYKDGLNHTSPSWKSGEWGNRNLLGKLALLVWDIPWMLLIAGFYCAGVVIPFVFWALVAIGGLKALFLR